ncbi:hypothetical protein [Modestobacter sp. SYSU DS0511]
MRDGPTGYLTPLTGASDTCPAVDALAGSAPPEEYSAPPEECFAPPGEY